MRQSCTRCAKTFKMQNWKKKREKKGNARLPISLCLQSCVFALKERKLTCTDLVSVCFRRGNWHRISAALVKPIINRTEACDDVLKWVLSSASTIWESHTSKNEVLCLIDFQHLFSSVRLKKPLVRASFYRESQQIRFYSPLVVTAVYSERCQARHLNTFLKQSLRGTGEHESLIRTRCCLWSMLTSLSPRGCCVAASGSFCNPSSLSSQVGRCASFHLEIYDKGNTLKVCKEEILWTCGFFVWLSSNFFFSPEMWTVGHRRDIQGTHLAKMILT